MQVNAVNKQPGFKALSVTKNKGFMDPLKRPDLSNDIKYLSETFSYSFEVLNFSNNHDHVTAVFDGYKKVLNDGFPMAIATLTLKIKNNSRTLWEKLLGKNKTNNIYLSGISTGTNCQEWIAIDNLRESILDLRKGSLEQELKKTVSANKKK